VKLGGGGIVIAIGLCLLVAVLYGRGSAFTNFFNDLFTPAGNAKKSGTSDVAAASPGGATPTAIASTSGTLALVPSPIPLGAVAS
jgi:hypothetical protein